MEGIKKTKSKFVWLVLNKKQAIELFKTNLVGIYVVHQDKSETLLTSIKEINHCFERAESVCIEIGQLNKP